MTAVRQVVLVLSERAAVALEETLENVPVPLLLEVREEIGSQLASQAPVATPVATVVAEKMAKAAAKAIETPEQRRTRILWAQDAKP